MKRRAAALLSLLLQAGAGAEALVTAAESAAEQSHLRQGVLMAKSPPAPGAPRIEVLEPDLNSELGTPFPVRIRFITDGKATLVPSSLRVYYGAFGVDITSRLLQQARFEGDTLVLDKAEVPTGQHRLHVKIHDSLDRSAEKLLTLTVTH